jgi:hypothetical protein
MLANVRHLLFGSPLPTAEEAHERLTKVKALAVFSGDALSSVVYAPEEILLMLVVAGSAALGLSLPIAVAIVVLLVIVVTSYYQTIHGYPSGGGAYIVAYDNLGVWPGLIAAAALLTDYVLTAAVSVTSGVAAVTSCDANQYNIKHSKGGKNAWGIKVVGFRLDRHRGGHCRSFDLDLRPWPRMGMDEALRILDVEQNGLFESLGFSGKCDDSVAAACYPSEPHRLAGHGGHMAGSCSRAASGRGDVELSPLPG